MRRTDPSLTFAPLRVRSFRFQWPADLLTSWAFEMETLILGWYVMVGTGSVLLLTVFGSLQQLGTLAAPMFGVLGDRLGGRAMLCGMRATYTLLAASLMILGLADMLTPALRARRRGARRDRPSERPGDAQCPDRRHHPARSPDGRRRDVAHDHGLRPGRGRACRRRAVGHPRHRARVCLRHDLLPGEPRLDLRRVERAARPRPERGRRPSRGAA